MPTRREFLEMTPAALSLLATSAPRPSEASPVPTPARHSRLAPNGRPLALTMWDFSWLERRWPGGGYEDWDRALDELVARGYDGVRIDAYPFSFTSEYDTWRDEDVSMHDFLEPRRPPHRTIDAGRLPTRLRIPIRRWSWLDRSF